MFKMYPKKIPKGGKSANYNKIANCGVASFTMLG